MKKNGLICIFFSLVLSIISMGCSQSKSVKVADYFDEYHPVPEGTALYFKRGACFGSCPIDEIFISLGGELQYKGERNTKYEGRFIAENFNLAKLETLMDELEAMDIYSFTEDYTGNIADFPPYTIFMQRNGKAIKIEAKSEYPEGLQKIIAKLSTMVDELELQPLNQ